MRRVACLLILALCTQGCYTTRHHRHSNSSFAKGVVVVAAAALVVDVVSYAIKKSIDRRHRRKITEQDLEVRRRWRDALDRSD
jgi:hypothetical protein